MIVFSLGLSIGGMRASGETRGSTFWTVMFIISGIASAILVILGIVPAVVMLFTSQWAELKPLLYVISVGALGYGLGYFSVSTARRRKYRKNPVMREAVDFCRTHNVVAVQCFADKIRFFSDLLNDGYCKDYINERDTFSQVNDSDFRKTWKRPVEWSVYDTTPCRMRTILFIVEGYANLTDLKMFANVLAREMRDCGVAYHKQSTKYDTESWSNNTKTITHHITVIYEDCFIYKKSLRKKKFPPAPKPAKKSAPQYKSWE